MNTQDIKTEFENLVYAVVDRPGLSDLMDWLGGTDFYTAPASTRFHGSYEHGLVEHSLDVYEELQRLCACYKCDASPESVAIVSLFHDLCKVNCYKTEMRWRKNDKNQWEQYPVYKFDEDFAYGGHGSKSVFLLQAFIHLTPEEASAINCHMGAYDAGTYSNPSEVYQRNLLAWLLHVADEAATYLHKEGDNNE